MLCPSQNSAKSPRFFGESSNMSSSAELTPSQNSSAVSGQSAGQPLSYHRLSTIMAYWEQREGDAPAHCSAEQRRHSASRTGLCVPVCQYQWFKRIHSTGTATAYHASHVRTPGPQLKTTSQTSASHTQTHINALGQAAFLLVQLHVTSLSPLPPSGWTMISPLLSVSAKLWHEHAHDWRRHKERDGNRSRHLSLLESLVSHRRVCWAPSAS